MDLFDQISKKLESHDITPSVQRIQVLAYLTESHSHPTADDVYQNLKNKMNSLSKATVYNTLALFAEKGIVRVLTLENNENRYDTIIHNHGHFICENCGDIFDFQINIDSFETNGINNCKISQKDVYFRGVCSKCLSK